MSNVNPNKDQFLQNPYPDDEIDLKELFMVLWRGKWLITGITGLAAFVSLVIALSLPNIYTASALLAPAESSDGGLSSLMKQYGGLASLAGVSLPGGEVGSRAQLGMQLMKSRAFIGDFVERRKIAPELMAVDFWDAETGAIVYQLEIYDPTSKTWTRKVGSRKSAEPTAQETHKAFLAMLGVSEDQQTGYVTVSVKHHSPIVAANLVTWLVEDVNSAVKAQDVAEAERSIKYLEQQVANTSLADLQMMFFELIQSQTETVMLAEVRPEYVFKTIDPAVIPELKSKPNRPLICIIGTFLGAFFGAVAIFIGHFFRSSSRDHSLHSAP